MASVSSLSGSSSVSSIYGNRNILSGLASGLDTESMIENSVAGIKAKIESLIQKQTKLSWKQDAYRSITDKMIALNNKYTSYTSQTNLSSNSFFTKAVKTTTGGKYADLITASGKTNSDIQINSVEQLATAARYSVSMDALDLNVGETTGGAINWDEKLKVSDIAGSMTLTYGNKTIDLKFDENETFSNAQELVSAIQKKLSEQNISIGSNTYKASERIGVSLDETTDTISFTDKSGAGNSVYISGVTGDFGKSDGPLSLTVGKKDDTNGRSFTVSKPLELSHEETKAQFLSGKTIDVTLDGTTKHIKIGDLTKTSDGKASADLLMESLQEGIKSAFGSKVSVNWANNDKTSGKLEFSAKSGSSLNVKGSSEEIGKALGLGKRGVSNYLNTGNTLKDLMGENMGGLDASKRVVMQGSGKITEKKDDDGNSLGFFDSYGNRVKGGDGDDKYDRLDDNGDKMLGYKLTINGKDVGIFNEDSSLESVFSAINGSDAGVTVNYSQLTNKLTFTAKETGADTKITFDSPLARSLFVGKNYNLNGSSLQDGNGNVLSGTDENGKFIISYSDGKFYKRDPNTGHVKTDSDGNAITLTEEEETQYLSQALSGYTAGQDAIVKVSVNGENITLERSGNTINMDGMSVTLHGTFNEGLNENNMIYKKDEDGNYVYTTNEAGEKVHAMTEMGSNSKVTFTTKADSDHLVETIKSFVDEYNAIIKEVHDAYATQPLEKSSSSHTRYEPLTEADKEGMSEDAIKAYEEKAKTGILFADTDLSSLYSRLRSSISLSGDDRKLLESIGLTTEYEDGVTTLKLNETQLRTALDNNPDSVRQAFTQSKENGASSDGIIARMKKTMDAYASTSIGNYGILVRKAGTKTKSLTLLDNDVQDQIDNLDDQIDKWQTKMSDKIDYYTRQFTALEQLMAQMNSQSSALAGMMGGGSY